MLFSCAGAAKLWFKKYIRCGVADPEFYWRQQIACLKNLKVDFAFEGKIGISAPNWSNCDRSITMYGSVISERLKCEKDIV